MQNFYNLPGLASRLDLACEATALLRGATNVEIAGISEEVRQENSATVHTITVLNEQGSLAINKPCGRYITIDTPILDNSTAFTDTVKLLAQEISRLLPPLQDGTLLLAGLGNNCAVADSLGPHVISLSYATRQLFSAREQPSGLSKVCLIAPGVQGSSGIATLDLLRSVCREIQPTAVIVIDSLAAASIRRVGTTIQLNDSGIIPGSGVGRQVCPINDETLGCHMIALGVPTVVDSAAIINETMRALADNWRQRAMVLPPDLDDTACEYVEKQLLSVFRGQLMVTPGDIDERIENQSEIIAAACAIYAHPDCTVKNYNDFIR